MMHLPMPPAGSLGRPAEFLYFEDNAADSLLVQSQFEKESALPAHFTVVDRLDEGLSLLRKQQFDLALLDLNLPDSQGLFSLDTLRRAAPHLPVVVISRLVDDKLAVDLLKHGAQDCISKGPNLASQIYNTLRFALRWQQTAIDLDLRVREADASMVDAETILAANVDAVVVLDSLGIVRYANPAAQVMFTSEASNILGQPLGVPIVSGPTAEIDIVRNNGEPGIAEIRVTEIDWAGERAKLATLRDITERKRMEAALLYSESKLRIFVEHAPAALAMFDREMRYMQVSRRWLSDFGLQGRELCGLSHYEILPDLPERWKQVYRRVLGGEVVRSESDPYDRADGSVQWLRWEARPWYEPDGKPGGLVIFSEDITARKNMEAALLQGEKLQALGTLAGGIAHDFNNILLAVSGNAKLALEQLSRDHPAYANVQEIAKAGSRAVALTKKILSFSRQQETALHPTQLDAVVKEVISLIRPTLHGRLELGLQFPSDLPPVMADASQIHQIIMNLAANAADAIGERPGRIEVSGVPVDLNGNGSTLSGKLPPGPYVRLCFQDNGPGIDKLTQSRIFEPFFTTKTQGRGTGMGLAIVHGIMKNHQGEVTVYSEPGKGTVFSLYFPVAQTSGKTLPASSAPAPQGQGQHILYVDDEEPLVLLITRTLQRLGYKVSGFTNPLEVLHILRQNPFAVHAIVTDLSMPQMSGIDFAQEVLQLCPAMPIIVTTGYIRAQDQELARSIGVKELILKPDTVEDLGNTLHRLLREVPMSYRAGS